MNTSSYFKITILITASLSFIACDKEKENSHKTITFNVGFEELKTHQGIYKDKTNDKEEIFFVKTNFNPYIRFYDLSGKSTDSISLKQAEDSIGRIGRISIISKDSIIVISYHNRIMAGIKRNNSFYFKTDLSALSNLTNEDEYRFWGSFFPNSIIKENNAIFITTWDGKKEKGDTTFASNLEYYKYILKNRMHSPMLCKVESIFSNSPKIKFTLNEFYYNKSKSIKSYGASDKEYALLNNDLFFISAHDRNIYKLNFRSLEIEDTIPVIPSNYRIPEGIVFANDIKISEDILAEQELYKECRITNMLYNDKNHKYYIFLRTSKDFSSVDELGYPFKIYIYDNLFNKEREIVFNTDEYNPKAAMITSKGIMIEKITKDKEYGKRTFDFLDL